MKFQFPLYAKILFWFFLNLITLEWRAGCFGAQFHPQLDSLLEVTGAIRIQAVAGDHRRIA